MLKTLVPLLVSLVIVSGCNRSPRVASEAAPPDEAITLNGGYVLYEIGTWNIRGVDFFPTGGGVEQGISWWRDDKETKDVKLDTRVISDEIAWKLEDNFLQITQGQFPVGGYLKPIKLPFNPNLVFEGDGQWHHEPAKNAYLLLREGKTYLLFAYERGSWWWDTRAPVSYADAAKWFSQLGQYRP